MKIYLDVDGTIFDQTTRSNRNDYGRVNYGIFEIVKKLQDAGHEIILNTNRNVEETKKVLSFINDKNWMFFKDRSLDLEINPIEHFSLEKIYPSKWDWDEMKRNGEVFLDDLSSDIPLKINFYGDGKIVDVDRIDKEFKDQGLY